MGNQFYMTPCGTELNPFIFLHQALKECRLGHLVLKHVQWEGREEERSIFI